MREQLPAALRGPFAQQVGAARVDRALASNALLAA